MRANENRNETWEINPILCKRNKPKPFSIRNEMSAECKHCGPNLNHFSINHFAKQIIQLYQCHVRINISEFCNFTISAHTGKHTHIHIPSGIRGAFIYSIISNLCWEFCRAYTACRAIFPAPIVVAMCSTKNQEKERKNEFEINTQWSLLLRFVRASDWKMCVIYHVAVSAK